MSKYRRRFVLTAVILALSAPFIIYGARNNLQDMLTLVSRWLPADYQEQKSFRHFIDEFESGDYIVISWRGCRVDDPRLAALEEAFTALRDAPGRADDAALFDRVLTGSGVLRQLTGEPLELDRQAALQRLRGSLVGVDGESSCALISLTVRGTHERERAVEVVLEEASRACGLEEDEFLLAGTPVEGVFLDRQSRFTADVLNAPAMLISAVLCWWCLRYWRYMAVVLLTALFGEGLVLAAMYYSGVRMSAVLIILPPLVFVLTVSAGVHLVNYYFDEVRVRGISQAPQRAMAKGWKPCTLAALTTAVGLGSLWLSEIDPVNKFGIFSSLGVLACVGILFLLLPGAMEWWPYSPAARRRDAPSGARSSPLPDAVLPQPPNDPAKPPVGEVLRRIPAMSNGFLDRFAALLARHATFVSLTFLGVALVAGFGLTWVTTSIRFDSLFAPSTRIYRDHAALEAQMGGLAPVEILVHFERECPLNLVGRFDVLTRIEQRIRGLDNVAGTMSATTFAPAIPPSTASQMTRRAIVNQELQKHQQEFTRLAFLHESKERQSFRITARVPVLSDTDYSLYLDELKACTDQTIGEFRERNIGGIRVEFAGVMPMVSKAQQVLLRDLFISFMTAFALVALAMILVLRSIRAGLIAMLPNLFPSVIIFGLMGWLGDPVDIGAMMTASVALGIAVDDTFHFVTWFRIESSNGHGRSEAVRLSFHHCARAMIQTTIICGLGTVIFGFSDFIPTRQFAFMMFTLLLAALAGDLVFLPAILNSRLGRSFAQKRAAGANDLAADD